MSDFTISDMIDSAARGSPSDFQTAFKDLVLDKIAAAIDQKRIEVAQNYFSPDEGEETEEQDTTEDNEENTDENNETDSGNEEEREA